MIDEDRMLVLDMGWFEDKEGGKCQRNVRLGHDMRRGECLNNIRMCMRRGGCSKNVQMDMKRLKCSKNIRMSMRRGDDRIMLECT